MIRPAGKARLAILAVMASMLSSMAPLVENSEAQEVARLSSQDSYVTSTNLETGAADKIASESAIVRIHLTRASTKAARRALLDIPGQSISKQIQVGPSAETLLRFLPKPGFYPADLSRRTSRGQVVTSAQSHDIYFNCPDGSCWGDPEKFLDDLGASRFIHLVDQYVGAHSDGRYVLGTSFVVDQPDQTFLSRQDVVAIVHAAASSPTGGTDYGHIYHVFLPQGTDTCADSGNFRCYSPDKPNNFFFCAYHGSATFTDIGEVLYSVEPFQKVRGCQLETPSPNGQLSDSTDSALSHELFETITDPDGQTWIALSSGPEDGNEIADICHGVADFGGDGIAPVFRVGSAVYKIQLEYSNRLHGCAAIP